MSGYEIEELARIEAALDDLVSPTSEDVFQATRPFDERAIASVAAARGGGGGAQPVFCVLSGVPRDVHAVTSYVFEWTLFYDNASDFNDIPGIPDGMGLALSNDDTFTVIESGVWVTECWLSSAADATWEGRFNIGAQLNSQTLGPTDDPRDVTGIFALPVGLTFQMSLTTSVASTANPYEVTPYLVLARAA